MNALLSPEDVLAALRELPGGTQLLDLAGDWPELSLVGGAVRDLMLGRPPRELDVTVAAGAAELARELAGALPAATTTAHEAFGTASLSWPDGRVDIAQTRVESYARPGALPDVRPAARGEDLARRDFTINAISLALGGELLAAEHALEDLAVGRMRVLHERSFIDDPTRLLRLARYAQRLGFELERHTAALAAAALADGALATVSGGRVGAELRLGTGEGAGIGAFAAFAALGVLAELGMARRYDAALAERALELLPGDGDAPAVVVAVALDSGGEREQARALLERLEVPADARERILAAAFDADRLAGAIAAAGRPSQLHGALAGQRVEAVALAGALQGRGAPAWRGAAAWLGELRHVTLEIDGEDLLAAGVPQGPGLGRRLRAALSRKLDGELAGGREQELRAALEHEEAP